MIMHALFEEHAGIVLFLIHVSEIASEYRYVQFPDDVHQMIQSVRPLYLTLNSRQAVLHEI